MKLNGKPVADKIRDSIINIVDECKKNGKSLPRLAIIRTGNRADDIYYEQRVLKNCQEADIESEVIVLDNNVNMESFMATLKSLNQDPKIHGILIFRPLPAQLDIDIISQTIQPEKDIDCMNPINMQKLFIGDASGIAPCTPEAVIEILKYYGYDLKGKHVVIVNRSLVLGKPLAMLLLAEDSTVTICHSKTKNLSEIMAGADIVVTGVGKAKAFNSAYFTDQSVVIDVGINFENGKLCGDVDYDSVSEHVTSITPVPGGVGTVTSMILLNHVIESMKQLNQ